MVIIRNYIEGRKRRKINQRLAKVMDKLILLVSDEINSFEAGVEIMKKKFNTDDVPSLINNFLFFRIAFIDIIRTTKLVAIEPDDQNANLHARTLALHLYEFLDDTQDFLGKKMKETLLDFPDHEYLIKQLYKLKECYVAIKKLIFKELGIIRNNTIGHKEQESIVLNKMIRNIKIKDIEVNSILIWILFMLIINFHRTVIYSIFTHPEFKLEEGIEKRIEEAVFNLKKPKDVQSEFNKIILMFHGVDPELAEIFCELSPEGWKNLKRLAEHFEREKNEKSSFAA